MNELPFIVEKNRVGRRTRDLMLIECLSTYTKVDIKIRADDAFLE